jgi:hypothetical protein
MDRIECCHIEKSANWETKRSATVAEQREIEQNERRWIRFQGVKLVDPFFCFQLQFVGVPPQGPTRGEKRGEEAT